MQEAHLKVIKKKKLLVEFLQRSFLLSCLSNSTIIALKMKAHPFLQEEKIEGYAWVSAKELL